MQLTVSFFVAAFGDSLNDYLNYTDSKKFVNLKSLLSLFALGEVQKEMILSKHVYYAHLIKSSTCPVEFAQL